MKTSKRKLTAVALVSAILAIGSVSPAAQATSTGTMALYFSAPFVTGSHVTASANTENFNGASCPTSTSWYSATHNGCSISTPSPLGTSTGNSEQEISVPLSKFAAGIGNGLGSTFSFEDGNPATVDPPVKYVGLWWMMGSTGNEIEFQGADGSVVSTLNVDEVMTFFGFANTGSVKNNDTGTLNTVDGGTHLRKHFFRSPQKYTGTVLEPVMNYEVDSFANEPWVYLNLFVSGDLGITKVKFTGNNFEIDNLTVSTVEATPRGDMVFVKGVAGKSVQFLPGASGVTGTTALQGSNTATNLRSNGFTRSGYTFTGWNTRQDGTGTPYAAGAQYLFASDLTLYAQWVVATSPPPSSGTASSSPSSVAVPLALAATGASETSLILPAIAASLLGFGLLILARINRIKSAARNRLSRIELDS
jgi:uncharacterized repeat protein (TIGR02543 family)